MCSQIGCLAHFTFVWTVDRVEYRSRACLSRIKTREKVPFILTVVYEANTAMGRCVKKRAHKKGNLGKLNYHRLYPDPLRSADVTEMREDST